jgi:hypothetical protein
MPIAWRKNFGVGEPPNWKRLSPLLSWKQSQPARAQLELWLWTDQPFRLGWRARRRIFDTASTKTGANAFGDELCSISLGGAPGISDPLEPCFALYRFVIRLPAALADPT